MPHRVFLNEIVLQPQEKENRSVLITQWHDEEPFLSSVGRHDSSRMTLIMRKNREKENKNRFKKKL